MHAIAGTFSLSYSRRTLPSASGTRRGRLEVAVHLKDLVIIKPSSNVIQNLKVSSRCLGHVKLPNRV